MKSESLSGVQFGCLTKSHDVEVTIIPMMDNLPLAGLEAMKTENSMQLA
jgi:hypothetical protein